MQAGGIIAPTRVHTVPLHENPSDTKANVSTRFLISERRDRRRFVMWVSPLLLYVPRDRVVFGHGCRGGTAIVMFVTRGRGMGGIRYHKKQLRACVRKVLRYVQRMRRSGEWGTGLEALAAAYVYGRPVRVWSPDGYSELLPPAAVVSDAPSRQTSGLRVLREPFAAWASLFLVRPGGTGIVGFTCTRSSI